MEQITPWPITITRVNLSDKCDLETIKTELFNLHCLTDGDDRGQSYVLKEFIPEIIQLRDEVITPLVMEYSKNIFGYDIPEIVVETSGKWLKENEGLFPHYHPGSCISAIFYPEPTKQGLNFFDPRTNACRGYPRSIREKHFKAHGISPAAGDLYIFPSYLQHSVSHVMEDLRLSLLNEYYLKFDL